MRLELQAEKGSYVGLKISFTCLYTCIGTYIHMCTHIHRYVNRVCVCARLSGSLNMKPSLSVSSAGYPAEMTVGVFPPPPNHVVE